MKDYLILRRGPLSLRLHRRALTVAVVMTAGLFGMGALALALGSFSINLGEVWAALRGQAPERIGMIVLEWRLPRFLLAVLLGAALGMSGAIFQSLTRNPLGSPDIIGFAAGSYTGALIVLLQFSGGYYATAAGALAGGAITALVVWLLAWRRGVQGFRLIVVGIGVSAMLGAFNAWMIRAADLNAAMSAAFWGAGSLNGLGWEHLWPVVLALAVIAPLALSLGRPMHQMEMGEDIARASGIATLRMRAGLMALGVALTAIATAAAGPIGFIALAAPQLARRVTHSPGVALFPAALMGAALLSVADGLAQHAFPVQLPVGLVTTSVGGLYFAWLLIREDRG
ncbi:FecCD family ABC transporter permease [Celeribacter sp. ULVN23_4]